MCTLLRHGAVIPSNVRKKQKRVHAEHGLLTSCHRFIIEFEARWGTRRHPPRACVIPIWLKKARGVPPFESHTGNICACDPFRSSPTGCGHDCLRPCSLGEQKIHAVRTRVNVSPRVYICVDAFYSRSTTYPHNG